MLCNVSRPMKTVLVVYAAFYSFVAIVTIVDDLRSGKSVWDTSSDLILLPLGLLGILLYRFDVSNVDVKSAWKIVAPTIVAGQIATNLIGRFLMKKRVGAEHGDAVLFSDVVSPLLLVPMFLANLAFAFR
jgi:hypothetical protein